jgi:hypothetical protein
MTSDETVADDLIEEMRNAIDAALATQLGSIGQTAFTRVAAQACAAVAAKRIEELDEALEATIPALEGQIESLFGSYRNLVGPDKGKVTDPDGLAWIAEFQEPLDIARAALSHRTGGGNG